MAQKTLFDRLYEAKEDFLKAVRKPSLQGQLERRLEGARDSAIDNIFNAVNKIHQIRENLKDYNVNSYLQQKAEIRNNLEALKDLQDEYKALFGKELELRDNLDDLLALDLVESKEDTSK